MAWTLIRVMTMVKFSPHLPATAFFGQGPYNIYPLRCAVCPLRVDCVSN